MNEYVRQPGDGCQLLGGGLVKHVDCHDYPAGTITNVITGEVVEKP